jgi:integrase/recombinase XerD
MPKDFIVGPRVRQPIEPAGFRRVVQHLETYLRAGGYAHSTISVYRQVAAHFAFWVSGQHVERSHVTKDHVSTFLSQHLASCRCPLGGTRQHHTMRAALRHLETVLDEGRYRPRRREPLSAVDLELRRFDDYLRTTCGLQPATRLYRRRYLAEFLAAFFVDGRIDPSQLVPNEVIQYVSQRAARVTPGSAKVLASSLRSYFRFLRLRGACDEALLLAVPAPANWRLASLPKVLTDAEVTRLLAAFDHRTATGRRDYAMTRCVVDLGLRAEDVVGLQLDDVDWRSGTMRIAGGKARRADTLPLTAPIGRAIAAYLRRGRPKRSTRQLFLCVRPLGRGITSRTVRNVVRYAARRAGLGAIVTGTRILRHTAATRMLRHGASIKEIADILRHRSLDTTAIYTKVDVPRLATVAAPWPLEARQ